MNLVTVLMPVYNGEKYLNEAIDSILSQSFTDFEFLIINDGSTDLTEEIILSYNDNRIRYVKNETNLKLIAALNRGIKLANGKYIVRMDADDLSVPNRIERQVDFMEKNPDVGLCGTWFETFDENGRKGYCRYAELHDEICLKHLYQIHLCHGTAILRKSILEESNLQFDSKFEHAEDYDLFTRISLHTKLANLPFIGYQVRHHENEVSTRYHNMQISNSLKVRKRQFDLLETPIKNSYIRAFEELNHQNYNAITLSPKKMRIMLESMLLGNQKRQLIDNSFFEKEMKSLWLNYCYHKSTYRIYRSSELLFDENLVQKASRVKWFLKTVFDR